jgi:hypothetical protein
VTFSDVTQAGTTSLTTSDTGPAPPAGFQLGTPLTYYDITTTASFSGAVEVCIDYTNISFGDESLLGLFHFEDPVWEDRTTSQDTTNNIICGSVTSLSPFALFESEGTTFQFSGFFPPVDNDKPNEARAGQTIPIKWRLTDAGTPVADPQSFVSVSSSATPGACGGSADAIETYAESSSLQYLGDGNWQFNWKTLKSYAGQCRIMRLNLADQEGIPSTRTAKFQFK